MDYEQFKEALKEDLEKQLGSHVEVYLHMIEKNNNSRKEVVTFRENGINMMPAIHLKELYNQYGNDQDTKRVVDLVLDILKTKASVDEADIVGTWPDVKDKIRIRMINYEWNQEQLLDVPCKRILDLAAVFQIRLHHDTCGEVTVRVTHRILSRWGVTPEELYKTALDNLKQEPYLIMDMNHVIAEMLEIEAEETDEMGVQHVMTNQEKMFGAAGILRTDLLEQFADKINSSFYILPSSVHELILVPDSNNNFNMEELTEMVSEINETQVEEEERLSNRAYYYNEETGQISI